MKLRYSGTESVEIRWKGEKGLSTSFSPNSESDIRDDLGQRLLANEDPKVKGKFSEVKTEAIVEVPKPEKPKKVCPKCQREFKGQGALNLHLKVHKE